MRALMTLAPMILRPAILALLAVPAGPAFAQLAPAPLVPSQLAGPLVSPQYNELWAQQEIARQQAVAQQIQLNALAAQIHTEQAIAQVQQQRLSPQLPPPAPGPDGTYATLDTGALASIPDDVLAKSDKAVRDAAGARR